MASQPAIVGLSDVAIHRNRLLRTQNTEPCEVDGRETHVQMEVELLLASGLAVGEARKLLGIPEDQLDLKTQPVEAHDFHRLQLRVGGGEHHVGICLFVHEHDDAKSAPEVRAVQALGIDFDFGFVFETACIFKPREVIEMHLAVVDFRRSGAFLARAVGEVAQVRVGAQFGDEVPPRSLHCFENFGLGVVAVGDYIADLAGQAGEVAGKLLHVKVNAAAVLIALTALRKIGRRGIG